MYNLIAQMAQVQSIEDLKGMMIDYFAREKIRSLALTLYKQHTKTGNQIRYEWVSSPLEVWHRHYLEQKYADIDRTLETSEHGLIPIHWNVHEQLGKAKNSRERRMRQESIDFEIASGLCIPVYGPLGDFLVLTLHQRMNENGLDNWQQRQFVWMNLTQFYFHYLRKLLSFRQEGKQTALTRREEQCLALTAEGLRIEMIAENLGISERTCHFHLQNANKKLGVNNKYLAVNRWQGEKNKS